MRAIVLVKISTGEINYAYRDLKRVRSLSKVHLTFGPFDAVVELDVKDLNALARVVALEIQPIPGVTQTLTCVMTNAEPLAESAVEARAGQLVELN